MQFEERNSLATATAGALADPDAAKRVAEAFAEVLMPPESLGTMPVIVDGGFQERPIANRKEVRAMDGTLLHTIDTPKLGENEMTVQMLGERWPRIVTTA